MNIEKTGGRSIFGVIAIFSLILGVVALTLNIITLNHSKKIGYVDTSKVFEDYAGKKELSNKLDIDKLMQKSMVDSLVLQLNVLKNRIDVGGEKSLKEEFNEKQKNLSELLTKLEDRNSMVEKQYSDQIIKQINQYTYDYGKENGYDIIFGANGSGNIMYGNDKVDITKQITDFLNKKYAGK